MPKISNLKSAIQAGKSVVGQVNGALEEVAGAAGKGGFSVSAGPNGVSISANFNELLKKKLSGNRIESPIRELYANQKTKKTLVYPADVDNEHYILFNVKRRKRLLKEDIPQIDTFQTIVLPVPSNLQVQQGASYSDTSLGIVGAIASGRINSADLSAAGTSLADAVTAKIAQSTSAFENGEGTDNILKNVGAATPILATAVGGKLAGALGGLLALGASSGGVSAGISVDTGLTLNPHMAVVFQGVGFRQHSFTYKFIARNQQESDTIKNIINTFKFFMLPSFEAGGLAFQYPDEFEIEFAEEISPYLYDIGTCVLENVSVNYNGEGMPIFYEQSGAPVSIEMSLQFKETQIFTKERLIDRIEEA